MRAILISIRPQWVEKILNGEKTIEIRKTKPNIKLPCKVYIYCTKGKPTLQYFYNWRNYKPISEHSTWADGRTINAGEYGNGKIVAEFTLKNIVKFDIESILFLGKEKEFMQKSCLGGLSLRKYLGNKIGYAWHVEDLKIYDKPRELSEFIKTCPYDDSPCKVCEYYSDYSGECRNIITRPPQSWRYVEKNNERD